MVTPLSPIEAYGARSAEYVAVLGHIDATAAEDRDLLRTWARGITGEVLDVGCGPGHWTEYLRTEGVAIAGIDPVPSFVRYASERYPESRFLEGKAEHLPAADRSIGGILVWYSLIHTPPEELGAALAECARVLVPGGSLAIGFFTGPEIAPFDHAVVTAYAWPAAELAARIESAGFDVLETHERTDPGARPHGAILARRSAALA
ncbi:class I SAM-dependent methyltransferase [Mycetocola tolaasinivorans]|uniref:Class I SAM-dependent methyltransferase n=1 Tax=Mycetocola tolaasinivorans TaxID=76635 RepID=A0A3L6ZZR4_9MICO|nr:class I SAM-dependent methyltransferase [Mycetocola tolaasinivorans]RLP73218.1 class I SAM-dependent methyltransferase [Mycetocola tolaasinivorans]